MPPPMRETTGRLLCAISPPCFPWRYRHCHDPNNRTTSEPRSGHTSGASANARASRQRGQRRGQRPEVTQRAVLDALEARYPMLRGTIRDHVTQERRPFLRFFACQEDLSHDSPDAPLPAASCSRGGTFFDYRSDRRRLARPIPIRVASAYQFVVSKTSECSALNG